MATSNVQAIDPRILTIGIEVNDRQNIYGSGDPRSPKLNIKATGVKFANANQDECEITITNLKEDTRNFILNETSPFNLNPKPKRAYVYAGRQSYGSTLIFVGDIVASSASQPPDIGVTIKCLALNFQKGKVVTASFPPKTSLSDIAKNTAAQLGVGVTFEATDKQISSYNYSGAAIKQVGAIGEAGEVDAYVDNGMLIVKDARIPLRGRVRKLSAVTGMVGVPEFTQSGLKVKFLLDNFTVLGGALEITSEINPATNGTYAIYKLSFELANRDTPFYWIAEASRIQV